MAEVERDTTGRWLPGRSPNPGGRPGGVREVREWARAVWDAHGREALLELALHGRREEVRLKAWSEILDRAFGRAPQAVNLTGADGGPLAFEPAGALVARLTQLIGERADAAALPGAPAELASGEVAEGGTP